MNDNPYQAPETFDLPQVQITDAEAIREAHLKTEASIKSIGILYWLAASALVIASLPIITTTSSEEGSTVLATGVALLIVGILQFVVGFEIRKLKAGLGSRRASCPASVFWDSLSGQLSMHTFFFFCLAKKAKWCFRLIIRKSWLQLLTSNTKLRSGFGLF